MAILIVNCKGSVFSFTNAEKYAEFYSAHFSASYYLPKASRINSTAPIASRAVGQDDSTQRCQFLEHAANVPYRSLITEDFGNLLVPGRSLSADREASASVRVMASMMGLGQAAGFAAAQCAKSSVSVQKADIAQLRKVLIDIGANI